MPQVFYRKYRPQRFSEFVGQNHVVKTLTNAISMGMISHAYLFSGSRGSGKTTLARIFAKAVNCKNRKEGEFEPCCQCNSCIEIQEGRSIDLIEIDAASHRGIDEVRELRDTIRFVPTKSKYKVYIIDEAHQLTKEAANALLKTLEEPPPFVIFILATTEPHKMIPTILSRCQRFDFYKLRMSEILEKLEMIAKNEKINIQKEALVEISRLASGSMRDAESLLDQVFALYGQREIRVEDIRNLLGLVPIQLAIEFFDFLIKKDAKGGINFLNEIGEKGIDLEEFAKSLIDYLRKVLIFKITNSTDDEIFSDLSKEELERLKEQSQKIEEANLKKIISLFLDAQNKMRFSPILQLPLELAIVEVTKWSSD
jgi:DNA polymerase-3 subunit gamma/tau